MGSKVSRPFPTKRERPIQKFISPFQKFYRYEASSGIILIISVAIALIWSNTNPTSYFDLWSTYLSVSFGTFSLSKPLYLWINDLLMALFFLLVGLEVKRELVIGQLRDPKNAFLPIGAAVGGIAVPALIYVGFNLSDPIAMRGWAIPAATDIAFALGVLYLLGDRVPASARIFLATLAIIDDIAAILIIAIFYTGSVSFNFIILAIVMFAILLVMNRLNVRRLLPYLLIGTIMWYGFFGSGIHATIAGVFLALTIPASVKIDLIEFRDRSNELLAQLDEMSEDDEISPNEIAAYQNTIAKLEHTCQDVEAPLQRLEHALVPWVIFGIMPIFALANAGVVMNADLFASLLDTTSIGIILGLVIGKPLGILLLSHLTVKTGLAKLPEDLDWNAVLGIGFLAGIGFTMSTFISSLAFEFYPEILQTSKLAILLASLISGVIGYLLLNRGKDESLD